MIQRAPCQLALYPARERDGTERELTYHVDDDSSGCSGGTNSDGPGGIEYECVEDLVTVTP